MDLGGKTDAQLDQLIANYASKQRTGDPICRQALEERARRSQLNQQLNLDRSMDCLRDAAQRGVCVSYGELAAASGVEWSRARQQMNGARGHLERLLDLCHARGMPLLTALCVNKDGVQTGELEQRALEGFAACARGLGFLVSNERAFHHRCRDECWEWGRRLPG